MLKWELYNKLPVDIQKEFDYKWGDNLTKLCLCSIYVAICCIFELTFIIIALHIENFPFIERLYEFFLLILLGICGYLVYYAITFIKWKQKVLIEIIDKKK